MKGAGLNVQRQRQPKFIEYMNHLLVDFRGTLPAAQGRAVKRGALLVGHGAACFTGRLAAGLALAAAGVCATAQAGGGHCFDMLHICVTSVKISTHHYTIEVGNNKKAPVFAGAFMP